MKKGDLNCFNSVSNDVMLILLSLLDLKSRIYFSRTHNRAYVLFKRLPTAISVAEKHQELLNQKYQEYEDNDAIELFGNFFSPIDKVCFDKLKKRHGFIFTDLITLIVRNQDIIECYARNIECRAAFYLKKNHLLLNKILSASQELSLCLNFDFFLG